MVPLIAGGFLLKYWRADDHKATVALMTNRGCARISADYDELWIELESGRIEPQNAVRRAGQLRKELIAVTDLTSELKTIDEQANEQAADDAYRYLSASHATA